MALLRKIQREMEGWQKHNFPGREDWCPLVGMMEELGELSHSFLKRHQHIRGSQEDHEEALTDALGDLFIFACDLANALGIDLHGAIKDTWEEVRGRDWQEYPINGIDR